MLSVREMQARLVLLQGVKQSAGEGVEVDVSGLCRIQPRHMPLVTAGEDASEYIPYAIHPNLADQLGLSVRRLREYMIRYVIDGTTVSAHTLPKQSVGSRAMMQSMRANQPQLSSHLLHHWCADNQGGGALRLFLHSNWLKAWKDKLPPCPDSLSESEQRLEWLGAVSILMLGMIRHEIARLPEEHAAMTDHIMVQVFGSAYHWLVQEFAGEHLAELDDGQRSMAVARMAVPATALGFFLRQPKGQVFADSASMVTAYGLEAELLPRMRQVSDEMSGQSAADVLAELSADALSDHLLKRSWARLSLREMAESHGQAAWMKWAQDVKRLDQLLSAPEKVAAEMEGALSALGEHPFAAWLLGHSKGGASGNDAQNQRPWREDERLLQVFGLFELDTVLEKERRSAEQQWLNREPVLVGQGRGSEAGRILTEAHAKGKIVFLQKDEEAALFVTGGGPASQGVLRVDWSDYLRSVQGRNASGMNRFLQHSFQSGLAELLKSMEGVFADSFSASGLLLRGTVPKLLLAAVAIRQLLTKWLEEMDAVAEGPDVDEPVVRMGLAMLGEWSMPEHGDSALAGRLAFSPGLAQAESAVGRNDGLHRLFSSFDARDSKRPIGLVRVEAMKMANGKSIPILCNRGIVMTGSALQALSAASAELHMQAFQAPAEQAAQQLPAYRLPGGRIEGVVLHVLGAGGVEADTHVLLRIGKVLLGKTVEDIYEVMDTDSQGGIALSKGLSRWQGGGAA